MVSLGTTGWSRSKVGCEFLDFLVCICPLFHYSLGRVSGVSFPANFADGERGLVMYFTIAFQGMFKDFFGVLVTSRIARNLFRPQFCVLIRVLSLVAT
jgi:hypothetical protein